MSKYNQAGTKPAKGNSPITAEATPTASNYHGVPGYARDLKSELFLLGVSNLARQDTFYEKADPRDARYAKLIREVAVGDPAWSASFLAWLRSGANMRSASLVGALEAAKAMLAANIPGSRRVVASVLQRADEPGEALGYWTSRYGRTIPKPVKRGIADAVVRLYSERSLLKYDTASKGFRFGDVIDLVHPSADASWQGDLFKHALDRRHGRDNGVPESLRALRAQAAWREDVAADRGSWQYLLDPETLRAAGLTWEDVLSALGSKVDKKKLWEALAPTMGYMSLLRNLRNFDQADMNPLMADLIARKLVDPEQVARSRQFPFRFYAAYLATQGSLRWSYPLERALELSLSNVPALSGHTLVLVDQSPSMFPEYAPWQYKAVRSDMRNADVAKLFGAALALRAEKATLVSYGAQSEVVPFKPGDALLTTMKRFMMINGTDTFGAIARHFAGHDRIAIVTDEQNQTYGYTSIEQVVPANVPVYLWNIGGYPIGSIGSGPNRNSFAGLTDAAFRMIPLIEAGKNGAWPWEAEQ